MKITGVEPILVEPRWLFVKISTDKKITGWGEALGDKGETIATAIRELRRYLIGKDPTRIEHHWQAMYRRAFWRGGPVLNAAISGVEMAMWDILGKSLNVPVYTLMGGKCRDKIRLYYNIGEGKEDDKERERAYEHTTKGWKKLIDKKGITAIKFCPFEASRPLEGIKEIKKVSNKVRKIREEIGNEIDLIIECHGRLSSHLSVVMIEEIAQYYPLFVEEPCLPENMDELAMITKKVKVPIATGERLFTKYSFSQLFERCHIAVAQPDLAICGGIMEGKKIAAIAEAHYASVAPHSPYGPILTAASLQLATCIPNFLIQEFCSFGEGVIKEPFKIKDGYVEIPTKPGLGIELDEDYIKKHPYQSKDLLVFNHEDGSIADW